VVRGILGIAQSLAGFSLASSSGNPRHSFETSIVFPANAFVVINELSRFSRRNLILARKSFLAKQTPLLYDLVMTERIAFTTDIVKDIENPGRFRWNIYENKKVRDRSFYSFATRREAQNDAERFVRKLNSIWPASREQSL
jgi:hypothetical protein